MVFCQVKAIGFALSCITHMLYSAHVLFTNQFIRIAMKGDMDKGGIGMG